MGLGLRLDIGLERWLGLVVVGFAGDVVVVGLGQTDWLGRVCAGGRPMASDNGFGQVGDVVFL
jgi:hypothetical protein